MKRILLGSAFTLAAAAAQACPNPQAGGDVDYGFTGDILTRAREYAVTIGGPYSLPDCGVPYPGYVTTAPTMSFRLARMDFYPLEIRVEAPCDAILLVNDASGNWHYNDDTGYGSDPRINLRGSAPLNGRMDIWVGSYSGETCYGDLILETERR